MEAAMDSQVALALLKWQVDLGLTEAIGDTPVNRYETKAAARPVVAAPGPVEARVAEEPAPALDAVGVAREVAARAGDLAALRAAMAAFEHCELKRGARNLVFSDGNPQAHLMVIGEAPGREEDRTGKPFVGAAGQLLDRMLEAIGRSRQSSDPASSVYIINVLPWRPPQNREPTEAEIAMMLPFLTRHVELAQPKALIIMGNTSAQAALGRRGITRLRGEWRQAFGHPAMAMVHPAYLLRTPVAKREAWADLLAVQARLRESP